MSGRASSGPPLSDSDNRLGRDGGGSGREREKGCVSVGGGTAGSCFPFTSALLYLSAVFPAPEDRKERFFFPLLCHYQEIIICCSVFHTDNQDWPPHGKFKNRTDQQHLRVQHAPRSDAAFGL